MPEFTATKFREAVGKVPRPKAKKSKKLLLDDLLIFLGGWLFPQAAAPPPQPSSSATSKPRASPPPPATKTKTSSAKESISTADTNLAPKIPHPCCTPPPDFPTSPTGEPYLYPCEHIFPRAAGKYKYSSGTPIDKVSRNQLRNCHPYHDDKQWIPSLRTYQLTCILCKPALSVYDENIRNSLGQMRIVQSLPPIYRYYQPDVETMQVHASCHYPRMRCDEPGTCDRRVTYEHLGDLEAHIRDSEEHSEENRRKYHEAQEKAQRQKAAAQERRKAWKELEKVCWLNAQELIEEEEKDKKKKREQDHKQDAGTLTKKTRKSNNNKEARHDRRA